jgi:hypothetical protein
VLLLLDGCTKFTGEPRFLGISAKPVDFDEKTKTGNRKEALIFE